MPAFLGKYLWLAINRRVKDRVHIDVHQVQQVFLVGRGHGIDRLVGVGHRVQKGLHRAFQQVHERLFHGKLLRPAQDRVLQDVEDARVVFRRRGKRDGKRPLEIRARQPQQARTGNLVLHHPSAAVYLGQLFAPDYAKPVQLHAFLKLCAHAMRLSAVLAAFGLRNRAHDYTPLGLCCALSGKANVSTVCRFCFRCVASPLYCDKRGATRTVCMQGVFACAPCAAHLHHTNRGGRRCRMWTTCSSR